MRPRVRLILNVVATKAGFEAADLLAHRRGKALDRARRRALWASKTLRPDMSFPQIGRIVERHHASVIHARVATEALLRVDERERAACDAIVAAVIEGVGI
jgi:chromosomal replication initiation ATPase DnaA